MPLSDNDYQSRLIVVDAGTTVDALRELVGAAQTRPAYVVLPLIAGAFAVTSLAEVSGAAARLGPSALDARLRDLPVVAQPVAAVERSAIDVEAARRLRDEQPGRRLVVVDGGVPVGLLANELRGSALSGLPLDLFGSYVKASSAELRERQAAGRGEETCAFCSARFLFYELRPAERAYACPHCHAILPGA